MFNLLVYTLIPIMLSSPLEVYSGDKLVIMCGGGESVHVLSVVSSFITVRLSTPRTRNRLVNKYHVSVSFLSKGCHENNCPPASKNFFYIGQKFAVSFVSPTVMYFSDC